MALRLESELLRRVSSLNEGASRAVRTFFADATLQRLAAEYDANLRKRHVDIGFNLFAIVSDLYYRENFHSDILKVLLDPASSHNEQAKYLHLFLKFLRSHGAKVALSDYPSPEVVREEGRIDILIRDESSHRAVIIENKINAAPDMPRQLPRYLEIVTAEGYTCDAIIYLRLNGQLGPDTTGWSHAETQQVKSLLSIIPAYAEAPDDLLNGWILPCQKASVSHDAQHILRQYGELIKKLGSEIMNKPVMDNFYSLVIQGDNLKTALSLKAMVEDLVLYRVEKLIAHFQHDLTPYTRIANYTNNVAYFTGLFWNKAHLGIDLCVDPESYTLQFWDRDDRSGSKGYAKVILRQMGCLSDFIPDGGSFNRFFSFPSQEQELLDYVTKFKQKLAATTANS